MSITAKIKRLGACEDAIEWAKQFGNDSERAWKECKRGDWMLWIIGRTTKSKPWSDGRKPLLACALDCAMTAKKYWPDSQKEDIAAAVSVLRKWIKDKASDKEARTARKSLAAATAAATAAYAADAADAAYATDAAYDAAYAATAAAAAATTADAADAADAAATAADTAANAAREKSLAKCANIVRKHFPHPPR